MTQVEELECRVKELQKIVVELQKEVIKIRRSENEIETPKNWKPQYDEKFWYRNVDGEIFGLFWKNTEFDKGIAKYNPIFKTEKECQKYCNYQKVLAEKSYKFSETEWKSDNICKYSIIYDYGYKQFRIMKTFGKSQYLGEINFKTHGDAQYMIDNYSGEMLKWGLNR